MSSESKKRPYRMHRRAELEEQTRLRITESAVALHEELGPARTSISAIADQAGVQRSTVYRHFPDEEALLDACSQHWAAQHPPPDPAAWALIPDPAVRLDLALGELYAFYRDTETMYTNLLRDEQTYDPVRRRLAAFHAYLVEVADALMRGRGLRGHVARRTRAAIGHAVAFPTWRSLTREQGLSDAEAGALMRTFILGAATPR